MAVDTAAKRYSMMTFVARGPLLPVPDGTIALADKQHLLKCYGGIAFALSTLVSIALRAIADHSDYLYRADDQSDYLYQATDQTDYLYQATDRSSS